MLSVTFVIIFTQKDYRFLSEFLQTFSQHYVQADSTALALHLQYHWMIFTWGHIILIRCQHAGAGAPWRVVTIQWQLSVLWGQTLAVWIPVGAAHRRQIRCSTGHGRPVSWHSCTLRPSIFPRAKDTLHTSRFGKHESPFEAGYELTVQFKVASL